MQLTKTTTKPIEAMDYENSYNYKKQFCQLQCS